MTAPRGRARAYNTVTAVSLAKLPNGCFWSGLRRWPPYGARIALDQGMQGDAPGESRASGRVGREAARDEPGSEAGVPFARTGPASRTCRSREARVREWPLALRDARGARPAERRGDNGRSCCTSATSRPPAASASPHVHVQVGPPGLGLGPSSPATDLHAPPVVDHHHPTCKADHVASGGETRPTVRPWQARSVIGLLDWLPCWGATAVSVEVEVAAAASVHRPGRPRAGSAPPSREPRIPPAHRAPIASRRAGGSAYRDRSEGQRR